jgi:hypothetical protein
METEPLRKDTRMPGQELIGSWKLVEIYGESDDGEIIRPYGESPAGVLMYTADGNMSAVLMKQARPKFASGDMAMGTPEEIRAAFEGFDAYCGTFTLDEAANIVTHHVEACRFPNWEGSDQIRYFELDANRLRIYTPPILALGKGWVIYVVWERK